MDTVAGVCMCAGTSGRSSPVQLTLVPGPGGALVQAPPLPAPDHAFESLASQLKRANQQPGGSAFNGTASGGGAVPADSTPSPAWRGVPRGVVPVGRGEAVILEAALDEALPQVREGMAASDGDTCAVTGRQCKRGPTCLHFATLVSVPNERSTSHGVMCLLHCVEDMAVQGLHPKVTGE
jgi:hypothetical protein